MYVERAIIILQSPTGVYVKLFSRQCGDENGDAYSLMQETTTETKEKPSNKGLLLANNWTTRNKGKELSKIFSKHQNLIAIIIYRSTTKYATMEEDSAYKGRRPLEI